MIKNHLTLLLSKPKYISGHLCFLISFSVTFIFTFVPLFSINTQRIFIISIADNRNYCSVHSRHFYFVFIVLYHVQVHPQQHRFDIPNRNEQPQEHI